MTQAEITALAMNLLSEHRLYTWSFRFDKHKRRFGVCHYQEQVIGLSWPVCQLNEDVDIIDTIKHEIAHALTPGACHGRVWKLAAMAIGARPETCAASHCKGVPGRWQYHCPCGTEYNRYRPPAVNRKYRCPLCKRSVIWTDTRAVIVPSLNDLYTALQS